ncbi:MAG: hypothetical protein Q9175_008171 [Cornicularia normoerica]
MLGIPLLLSFLQISLSLAAQAASLQLLFRNTTITLTGTTTIENTASISFPNPSNELSVIFVDAGDSIPADELRHTLSVASAIVQDYLPRHAYQPISNSFFEKNISFPETEDSVCVSVYAYGHGLSWMQLSHVLMILRAHMLGTGPGHPLAHSQQLRFYVQLAAGIEVAHGGVGFAPGARAVAKRNLGTTTIELPHANVSSLRNLGLPIIFHIPKTNLDFNITSLSLPVPPSTIFTFIESAYTDIILTHTDIDSPIPVDRPFSFNETYGISPHRFNTKIEISAYPGKQISWGLLYILLYGLEEFMLETRHFNALKFEINDAREGKIGHGEVFYGPATETASIEGLKMV